MGIVEIYYFWCGMHEMYFRMYTRSFYGDGIFIVWPIFLGESEYYFSVSLLNQSDSQIACENLNGELASLTTHEERQFISETLFERTKDFASSSSFYVSLHRNIERKDLFIWGDTESALDSLSKFWAPMRPFSEVVSKTNCVVLKNFENSSRLYDVSCSDEYGYICERPRGSMWSSWERLCDNDCEFGEQMYTRTCLRPTSYGQDYCNETYQSEIRNNTSLCSQCVFDVRESECNATCDSPGVVITTEICFFEDIITEDCTKQSIQSCFIECPSPIASTVASSITSSTTADTSQLEPGSGITGAVIGAAIGGSLFVIGIMILIVYIIKRNARNDEKYLNPISLDSTSATGPNHIYQSPGNFRRTSTNDPHNAYSVPADVPFTKHTTGSGLSGRDKMTAEHTTIEQSGPYDSLFTNRHDAKPATYGELDNTQNSIKQTEYNVLYHMDIDNTYSIATDATAIPRDHDVQDKSNTSTGDITDSSAKNGYGVLDLDKQARGNNLKIEEEYQQLKH